MERRNIVETRYIFETNNDEAVYDIEQFVADVQEAINAVPPEHRADARIVVAAHGESYAYATGVVRFTRPETDEEIEARKARADDFAYRAEMHQRAEYERLKKKFEGKDA